MEPVIVFVSLFFAIFAIAYLHYSTRNKERLALIEKGADASIFFNKDQKTAPVWKIFLLNLSLLLIGVGVGIFLASFMHYQLNLERSVAYPGTIFLLSGIGLFIGFHLSKKLD
ncbi:DUF6249 domain-containing protein [Imtechella halotolerans]|uniref:DUF6249 domain-containing protein n=1 Tax=Imtechella halotolerans K1 TaxID=946077 RepID=I0WDP1_9FLAO|nr:DUF6249 domain-containing protein [Imtechella halotolerans]EID74507.1 hypothetical protein W5A_08252 [Imtechella halotolerans K1]WMQ62358.1 DUF6249 domain-containing protein [Imtechella halotolerans]